MKEVADPHSRCRHVGCVLPFILYYIQVGCLRSGRRGYGGTDYVYGCGIDFDGLKCAVAITDGAENQIYKQARMIRRLPRCLPTGRICLPLIINVSFGFAGALCG